MIEKMPEDWWQVIHAVSENDSPVGSRAISISLHGSKPSRAQKQRVNSVLLSLKSKKMLTGGSQTSSGVPQRYTLSSTAREAAKKWVNTKEEDRKALYGPTFKEVAVGKNARPDFNILLNGVFAPAIRSAA